MILSLVAPCAATAYAGKPRSGLFAKLLELACDGTRHARHVCYL